MLVNLSNHPSAKWTQRQREAAQEQFGGVTDLPFPEVDPALSTAEVSAIATEYLEKILRLRAEVPPGEQFAIHVMGEFSFTFALTLLLKERGIPAILSTTARMVRDNPDGSSTTMFEFRRFRRYW